MNFNLFSFFGDVKSYLTRLFSQNSCRTFQLKSQQPVWFLHLCFKQFLFQRSLFHSSFCRLSGKIVNTDKFNPNSEPEPNFKPKPNFKPNSEPNSKPKLKRNFKFHPFFVVINFCTFSGFLFLSSHLQAQSFQYSEKFETINWPEFYSGDTHLFSRKNAIVTSASPVTEKHDFQLIIPFNPQSYKNQIERIQNPTNKQKYSTVLSKLDSIKNTSGSFHFRFGVDINLSSVNKVALCFRDTQNRELKINWGNTKDQIEIFLNGKSIYSGQEYEFNVSKFNQDIWIDWNSDSLKITTFSENSIPVSIDKFNDCLHQITVPLNSNYSIPFWAIFQISQSGKTAIGSHRISQINWSWGQQQSDTFFAKSEQISNNQIRLQFLSKSNWLLLNKLETQSVQPSIFNYFIEGITIRALSKIPNFSNVLTFDFDTFSFCTEFEITLNRETKSATTRNIYDSISTFFHYITRGIIHSKNRFKNDSSFSINPKFIAGKIHILSFDTAEINSIFITEIMSDTKPNYGRLPEFQYIEIFNTQTKPIDLNTLFISKYPNFNDAHPLGNRLKASSIVQDTTNHTKLHPNWQFQKCLPAKKLAVIVSNSDSTEWKQWLKQPTKSKIHPDSVIIISCESFPRLNLSDGHLYFFNNKGNVISRINYSKEMIDYAFKDGGVSLEILDTLQPYSWNFNAKSNSNFGGSPGYLDSVNPYDFPNQNKTITYRIEDAFCTDDSIFILWNHPLPLGFPSVYLKQSVTNNSFYSDSLLVQNLGNTMVAKWKDVLTLSPCSLRDTFTLLLENSQFNVKFATNNSTQSLCKNQNIYFHSGDSKLLRFNEVLNNNFTGFADFFELVNNDTTHSVDLENWDLLYYDDNNFLKLIIPLKNSEFRFIPPNEFRVFTDDKYSVYRQFPHCYPFRFAQINSIPDISFSTGKWILNHHIYGFQDEISLTELNKIYPHLQKGFSLEKMHPSLFSGDAYSWFPYFNSENKQNPRTNLSIPPSGATPGEINSHAEIHQLNSQNWVHLPQKVIKSQSDNNIILPIEFNFPQAGYYMNAAVYNASGRQIYVAEIPNPLPASGSLFLNLYSKIYFNGNYVIKFEANLYGKSTKRTIKRFTIFN